jgi:hypothetical protein
LMTVFFFRQPTVAACWGGRCIPFLGALLLQVITPAPQAAGRLLAFTQKWPNFWQLWHCVRPFWTVYTSTLIAMWKWLVSRKISWDFAVPGKVIRKREGSYDFLSLGMWPTGGCHLLDANKVETEAHQPMRYVVCMGVVWQVAYHRTTCNRTGYWCRSGIWRIGNPPCLSWWLVPFLVLRNSKFPLTTLWSCFWNWISLMVDYRIIGGGLPVLPGTASSFEVPSVPEASVSMSAALGGADV